MKKIIFALLLIIAVHFAFRLFTNHPPVSTTTSTQTAGNQLALPANWHALITDSQVAIKLQKDTDGFKPEVSLIISEMPTETANFSIYTKNIVAGLRSTLPQFRVLSSKLSQQNDYDVFDLTGSYPSKSGTINVIQKLYYKNNSIYTLTGSYTTNNSNPEEINNLFTLIFSQHHPN